MTILVYVAMALLLIGFILDRFFAKKVPAWVETAIYLTVAVLILIVIFSNRMRGG